MKSIAVDIGGTKVAVGVVNENSEVLWEEKAPSDPQDAEKMFGIVADLIHRAIDENQLTGDDLRIGCGVPGLVDRKNGIAVFQNNLNWSNFPIKERLQSAFPEVKTIAIDNDVYQAAFAEWHPANLGEEDVLVFLTASTGISAAILKGGEFIRGCGFAGEVGMLPVKKVGEDWVRVEQALGGNNLSQTVSQAWQETVTTKEIFERYYQNDEAAVAVVNEWLDTFAMTIYQLICIFDPQKLVLGGSVIKLNEKLLPELLKRVEALMLDIQKEALQRIAVTEFDNNAGLIGAGMSAF